MIREAVTIIGLAGVLQGCVPTVRIAVNEALVGPDDWDGMGSPTAEVVRGVLASSLALGPAGSFIVDATLASAMASWAPPDPFGTAHLRVGRRVFVLELPVRSQNYQPSWRDLPSLGPVRLDDRVTLDVHLWDEDLNAPDDIGTARFDYRALRRSARTGRPVDAVTDTGLAGVSVSAIRVPGDKR